MKSCVLVRRKLVVWKDYMKTFMNEEIDLGHNVEEQVDCIIRVEVK